MVRPLALAISLLLTVSRVSITFGADSRDVRPRLGRVHMDICPRYPGSLIPASPCFTIFGINLLSLHSNRSFELIPHAPSPIGEPR